MVTVLFILTATLYAVSCTLYLVLLARGDERVGRAATGALVGAVVAHGAFLAADYTTSGNLPYGDIHQTLSLVSFLTVLVYLLSLLRYRALRVLGGFITPLTLLFFLAGGLGFRVAHVPADVRSALMPLHIGVNILGIVAFALAFAAAIAYLVQERLLRRKQIGGLFQRLPALDQLDSLGLRLVTVGFPLLTIGIVTGTIWAVRLDASAPLVTPAQGFALVAWVIFGAVLLLRVAAGWRGRRAAIGTMVGFLCAAVVLVGYVVRSGAGS
jgi:ABC-type uncharacterized transport system permease subunit